MFKIFNGILDNNKRDKIIAQYGGKDYKKFINNTGFNVFIGIAIVFCVLALFFISSAKPPTKFYLVDTEKKEMKVIQTSFMPIISSGAVETWNSNAIINIFTFNFSNYNERLGKSKIFFTAGGYKGFMAGMEKSGMLDAVKNSSLEVTVTPLSKSVIVTTGKSLDGSRKWTVEMSAFVSYMGTGKPKNEKTYIVTELVEVPTYENPNGIAIKKINMVSI